MKTRNYIIDIVKNIDKYPEFKKAYLSLTEDQKFAFLNMVNGLDVEKLYVSPIHGQFHSEKVLLFAYLLATKFGYNAMEMKIITDAAIYHDMGRQKEFEDSLHGLISGNMFADTNNDIFYDNPFHINLIKALMDIHSIPNGRDDFEIENVYYSHDLEDSPISFERFKEMAHLLMDADALDRKRFADYSPAGLKPEFLHYPESHELIGLATEINIAYKDLAAEEEINLEELYISTGAVVHSVGYVFPRVLSILTHGILSATERKKNSISMHRNFEGGNSNRWISVVPLEKVADACPSLSAFLSHGIIFVTKSVDYYETPYGVSEASIALDKNLPYNKGGHDDERYVLDRIEPSKFTEIYIPKQDMNKDLTQLKYIFPNMNIDQYVKMIDNFLDKYNANQIYRTVIVKQIEQYKTVLFEYYKFDKNTRDRKFNEYAEKFDELNNQINSTLAMVIKKYYIALFKLKEDSIITPVFVLEDELIQAGIEYDKVVSESKTSFFIELNKKNTQSKQK